MRTPRVLLGSLGATAAAVALVTAAAVPAGAAGPYTVKAGTKTTGTTPYTAPTIGASPQIKFAAGGVNMSCESGSAKGAVKLGNNANGVGIATITGTDFNNCKGPANLDMSVIQRGVWKLNAVGPVSGAGVTKGKIVAIQAHVQATANPSQCQFDVKGTVAGTFANNSQQLKVNGASTLTLSNVQGCFGLLSNGDKATFTATYKLNASAGKVVISNA